MSEGKPRGKRAQEAAEYLGVGVSTIWALRAAGEIEAVKLAERTTIFLVDSLDRFVDRKQAQQRHVEAAAAVR